MSNNIHHVSEAWQLRKSAVSCKGGMVASQHYLASEAGAEVLAAGGNAIDAAIATGLTLGTVEPWMSGIGGGGYMLVSRAGTNDVQVVEFGMRAPLAAQTSDYPLAGGGENSTDAFNWPKVVGDTNVEGPLSIAVPGYLKGISRALEEFGTMSWRDVIEPACLQAEWGLPVDWFTSMKVNFFARSLAKYEETSRTYLADGLPPAINVEGNLEPLRLGNLAQTYRQLQAAGADDFYNGELAQIIAGDLAATGSRITMQDLAEYEARIAPPLTTQYRGNTIYSAGHLTAGPSLAEALANLETHLSADDVQPHRQSPGVEAFSAYAESLLATYRDRLENLGEGESPPGNTSHICVADEAGNIVSLTQTIMSGFGARVMLPRTGILMNNGMMWFDPVPGKPNSVAGGRRPLCNMCPTIAEKSDGSRFAVGACGGRKIFPAVFQLVSFMLDYDLSVDEAVHHPRIDNSGTDMITIMDHMPPTVIAALAEEFRNTRLRPNGVSPNFFALPQLVLRRPDGMLTGGCFVASPHAKVSTC